MIIPPVALSKLKMSIYRVYIINDILFLLTVHRANKYTRMSMPRNILLGANGNCKIVIIIVVTIITSLYSIKSDYQAETPIKTAYFNIMYQISLFTHLSKLVNLINSKM